MAGVGEKRRAPANGYRRARPGAGWEERCSVLYEDLRKPARVMVARAYGRALSPEEVEDVYANAWTSTLAALRGREATMSDEELRSYLLTAVAGHAGKEMRRRSRKPSAPLEDVHAQVLADAHQPSPEERVAGAETASVARDLLASLPPRRRAVMLLRYGWGLSPAEICGMVAGLSPRAYRKEITRGVEEMIERLGALESGGWCESRLPILRDYVAGLADEETRRQAVGHVAHCRQCAELVRRLSGRLHELGSGVVLGTVALEGTGSDAALLERISALADRGREGLAERAEAAADLATGVAMSGAGRGAGATGTGIAAKLATLGAAGKTALACVGVGAAAGAFIAVGVVPGVGTGAKEVRPEAREKPARAILGARDQGPPVSAEVVRATAAGDVVPVADGAAGADRNRSDGGDGEGDDPAEANGGDPPEQPAAGEQEFGLPTPSQPAPEPAPEPAATTSGGSADPASTDEAVREFGP